MAALTQNSARSGSGGIFRRIPLAANAAPFQGSLLGYASGLARALVAGDKFAGLARTKPEPSTVAGLAKVEADTGILQFRAAAITGLSGGRADIGTKVYAANDNDLTNVASGNSLIGSVSDYDAATGYEVTGITSDIADSL
jgi:hypothetical protein